MQITIKEANKTQKLIPRLSDITQINILFVFFATFVVIAAVIVCEYDDWILWNVQELGHEQKKDGENREQ